MPANALWGSRLTVGHELRDQVIHTLFRYRGLPGVYRSDVEGIIENARDVPALVNLYSREILFSVPFSGSFGVIPSSGNLSEMNENAVLAPTWL
ncbi:MAG: hypothetical protein V5A55_07625 [Halovenus sp.]